MTDADQQKTKGILEAAGSIGRLLPQAAGVAVSLTAIAYYAGWRDASAYFGSLGAPWVVPMLPTSSFLYLSAELVAVVLLVAFFAVHSIATDMTGLKGLNRVSLGVFIISAILVALARWLPSTWLSAESIWHISTAGGVLFAAGAGLTLGEVAARLSESKLQWSPTHAYLVYTAIFGGIYLAPAQLGAVRARFHLDAPSTALSRIKIPNATPDQHWFLLAVLSDKVLAMEKTTDAQLPIFRVVAISDLISINALPK